MSATWHRAGRRHPCIMCYSKYENKARTRCSSRAMAETTDTGRSVVGNQAEAASLGGRVCNTRRRELQSDIAALLFWQSLEEYRYF